MESFRKYYYEQSPEGAGITFVDVDETLFHTKARVHVKKDGNVVRSLTNREYNTDVLNPGEHYDFGEFKDAKYFRETSEPIEPVLKRVNRILHNIELGKRPSDVVILTARSHFDNQEEFKNAFRDHGVWIDEVDIKTVGGDPGAVPDKKKNEVRRYLASGKYSRARMFDDSIANLKAFKSLEKEFPEIEFKALAVTPSGKVHELKSN